MNKLRLSTLMLAMMGLVFFSCDNDDDTTPPTNPDPPTEPAPANAFVSTNAAPEIGELEFPYYGDAFYQGHTTNTTEGDGIAFDNTTGLVYQNDRTTNIVNAYAFSPGGGASGSISPAVSTGIDTNTGMGNEFAGARGVATNGSRMVVAQSADQSNMNTNKFVVYDITGPVGSDPGTITFSDSLASAEDIHGVELHGNTLYATQGTTGNVAVYENFFNNTTGTATPSKTVSIEGVTRAEGIRYSPAHDRMVLTDIGDETMDDDGAVVVIDDFSTRLNTTANNGTISVNDQVRINNPNYLGNPADVDIDDETERIYVAERSNSNGRVLVFDHPNDNAGNAIVAEPVQDYTYAGASSISLRR